MKKRLRKKKFSVVKTVRFTLEELEQIRAIMVARKIESFTDYIKSTAIGVRNGK